MVRKRIALVVIAVVLVGAGGYAIFAYANGYPPFCSGYPPGGDCRANYSYTFTLSVDYGGPWKVSYQGYNSGGPIGNPLVDGSYSGSGNNSKSVTLTGENNQFLTLCATWQKLDASNSTLILTITGYNETSLPYGSTSYCGGVAP